MSVKRCLYPLFQNLCPHFLLSPLFWKLSPPSGQDQKNGKQTYRRLPQLTSRIHPLIFLWTPKGFISPESFLDFFLNLYILPWLQKTFKFMELRLLANTFLSQKIKSVHFYSYPQAKLSAERGVGGREDHGGEQIKPTRVLLTSFDKFHHLCSLHIFGFCFAVP